MSLNYRINCCTSIQKMLLSTEKNILLRHPTPQANLKFIISSLHTVGFHLHSILKQKEKSRNRKQSSCWQGLDMGTYGEEFIKRATRKFACEFMCPHLCFQQIKFGYIKQPHRALFPWLLKARINFILKIPLPP